MVAIPATCEVWVDGVRYPDGQPSENGVDPFALSGLTIQWGRDNTVDQPDPATCTFSIADPPGGDVRFDATVKLGSSVAVWAVLDAVRSIVFAGRVTDLQAEYDEDLGAAVCSVIAADQLADMANRFVGAEPWPAELLWVRAQRILTAIGLDPSLVLGFIPVPVPGELTMSRMDVDRQAATPLLQELAVTGGAVLWSSYNAATNSPYLIFENPGARASLYVFAQQLPSLLWAPQIGAGAGTGMSACNVLQEPVRWSREVGDLITRVTVRWLDQSTMPDPTEKSFAIIDAANEAKLGARGLSVGTILTSQADAQNLAARLEAAHQPSPNWRTTGLTWDLSQTDVDDAPTRDLARTLLDNTLRLGYAIQLTDLPYWTPTNATTQLYIEGGTYSFEDGHWVLALQGAPATGLGSSLTYGQTDQSVRFADVDPAVQFLGMIGVGPAGATGPAWSAIPTATHWDTVPAGIDWSEDPR